MKREIELPTDKEIVEKVKLGVHLTSIEYLTNNLHGDDLALLKAALQEAYDQGYGGVAKKSFEKAYEFFEGICAGQLRDTFISELSLEVERLGKALEAKEGEIITEGSYGSYYSPPTKRRAYSYKHQPDNVGASLIGQACEDAYKLPAGDSIDRGLGLLKELQARGYGVYMLGNLGKDACAG